MSNLPFLTLLLSICLRIGGIFRKFCLKPLILKVPILQCYSEDCLGKCKSMALLLSTFSAPKRFSKVLLDQLSLFGEMILHLFIKGGEKQPLQIWQRIFLMCLLKRFVGM